MLPNLSDINESLIRTVCTEGRANVKEVENDKQASFHNVTMPCYSLIHVT